MLTLRALRGKGVCGERETLAYWLRDDLVWVLFFAAGTAVYLGLRVLKRHTSLLSLPKVGGA